MQDRFFSLCDYAEAMDEGTSEIVDVLFDYYLGDEESGPLLGSYAGLDLAAVNSPGTTAGPGGKAARTYTRSPSTYHSRSMLAGDSIVGTTETGFSVWLWCYATGLASGYYDMIRNANHTAPPNRGLQLFYWYGSGSPYYHINRGPDYVVANSATASQDAWHFVYAEFDPSTGRPGIGIDGGAMTYGGVAGQPFAPATSADQFLVGKNFAGFEGAMCGLGFAHAPLDPLDVAFLYNGGNGPRSMAELLAYRREA